MSKLNFIKIFKNIEKIFKNLDRKALLSISVAAAAIIIVGTLILTNGNSGQFLDKIKNFGGTSKDDLAKTAIDYINNNVLTGQKAVLNNVSEESGLVKINFNIGTNKFDSYVTKDGSLLFPEAIKLKEGANISNPPAGNSSNSSQQPSCGV